MQIKKHLQAHVVMHIILLSFLVLQYLKALVICNRDRRDLFDLPEDGLNSGVALAGMAAPSVRTGATL